MKIRTVALGAVGLVWLSFVACGINPQPLPPDGEMGTDAPKGPGSGQDAGATSGEDDGFGGSADASDGADGGNAPPAVEDPDGGDGGTDGGDGGTDGGDGSTDDGGDGGDADGGAVDLDAGSDAGL